MQDAHALLILEAAYDLSEIRQEAIPSIARAATRAIPCGPVVVAWFDTNARLDPSSVRFERASRIRYIVAHENPTERARLRALSPREHSVLEFAVAGRSGKWIAFELQFFESAVTRTLGSALRTLGAANIAALAGVRNALFEPLDCRR